MNKKINLLKQKIDIVFHSLFRVGNEEIKKEKLEIARKLKLKNFPISSIVEITELTEQEINKI